MACRSAPWAPPFVEALDAMYFVQIALLMVVLPIGSIVLNLPSAPNAASVLALAGTWFVFWSVGVRLFAAGLRQSIQPRFTAEKIFQLGPGAPLMLVQELGFANIAIGLIGIGSRLDSSWTLPAAVAGGVFYGLAGFKHLAAANRNRLQNVAMVSDLFIFVVLAAYVAGAFLLSSHPAPP